jgi:hypothetical protein
VKAALFLGGQVELRLDLGGVDVKALVAPAAAPTQGQKVRLSLRRGWRF